ncbi:MAG: efflux RND transporter periplasmic adaptor subunit [Chloroflexi bacterium]|nr:efflux RND transporter periplasmic adaptor subunit [Chloroflexota bacterium]
MLLVAGLLLAATSTWVVRSSAPGTSAETLTASGNVEADEVVIAPQVTAQILSLPVPEGSAVAAGAIVATLDQRLVQLQMLEADAATYRTLQLQIENYTLRSPVSGIVTREPAKAGEVAMPGQVLLAVADLRELTLTLYVRESQLAQVFVGQALTITADPFPGRTFSGQVTSINSQAEFTPRNVQTQTDRLNLVFGVQAHVDNPDAVLKPGMPVDARFDSGSR